MTAEARGRSGLTGAFRLLGRRGRTDDGWEPDDSAELGELIRDQDDGGDIRSDIRSQDIRSQGSAIDHDIDRDFSDAVGRARAGARPAPVMPSGAGPFDAEELGIDEDTPDTEGRIDFGSVRIRVPGRGTVKVEPTANGKVQAVHVQLPEGRLSISALAAPRSGTLWPDLASEIDASLRDGGARVRSFPGEWGRELRADTGAATSLFVGVDGTRWMIYGVATGQTKHSDTLESALRTLLRDTVVVRGRAPYPVRTVLPLSLPEGLDDAIITPKRKALDAAAAPAAPAPAPAPAPARPSPVPLAPTTSVPPPPMPAAPGGLAARGPAGPPPVRPAGPPVAPRPGALPPRPAPVPVRSAPPAPELLSSTAVTEIRRLDGTGARPGAGPDGFAPDPYGRPGRSGPPVGPDSGGFARTGAPEPGGYPRPGGPGPDGSGRYGGAPDGVGRPAGPGPEGPGRPGGPGRPDGGGYGRPGPDGFSRPDAPGAGRFPADGAPGPRGIPADDVAAGRARAADQNALDRLMGGPVAPRRPDEPEGRRPGLTGTFRALANGTGAFRGRGRPGALDPSGFDPSAFDDPELSVDPYGNPGPGQPPAGRRGVDDSGPSTQQWRPAFDDDPAPAPHRPQPFGADPTPGRRGPRDERDAEFPARRWDDAGGAYGGPGPADPAGYGGRNGADPHGVPTGRNGSGPADDPFGGRNGADPYGADPYGAGRNGADSYGSGRNGADPYGADPYGAGRTGSGSFGDVPDPYVPDPYAPEPYAPDPYGTATGGRGSSGNGRSPYGADRTGPDPYASNGRGGADRYGADPALGALSSRADDFGFADSSGGFGADEPDQGRRARRRAADRDTGGHATADRFGTDSYGTDSYGTDSYGTDSYGTDRYGSDRDAEDRSGRRRRRAADDADQGYGEGYGEPGRRAVESSGRRRAVDPYTGEAAGAGSPRYGADEADPAESTGGHRAGGRRRASAPGDDARPARRRSDEDAPRPGRRRAAEPTSDGGAASGTRRAAAAYETTAGFDVASYLRDANINGRRADADGRDDVTSTGSVRRRGDTPGDGYGTGGHRVDRSAGGSGTGGHRVDRSADGSGAGGYRAERPADGYGTGGYRTDRPVDDPERGRGSEGAGGHRRPADQRNGHGDTGEGRRSRRAVDGAGGSGRYAPNREAEDVPRTPDGGRRASGPDDSQPIDLAALVRDRPSRNRRSADPDETAPRRRRAAEPDDAPEPASSWDLGSWDVPVWDLAGASGNPWDAGRGGDAADRSRDGWSIDDLDDWSPDDRGPARNGHANGHTNGYANGHTNGHGNGRVNGYADDSRNGYVDGSGADGSARPDPWAIDDIDPWRDDERTGRRNGSPYGGDRFSGDDRHGDEGARGRRSRARYADEDPGEIPLPPRPGGSALSSLSHSDDRPDDRSNGRRGGRHGR